MSSIQYLEKHAAIFSGMLEIGGAMIFDVSRNNKSVNTTYTYPKIAIGNTEVEQLAEFRRLYGGSISVHWNRAHQWGIKNKNVPQIAVAMKPFVRFRQPHVAAFEHWSKMKNWEQRRALALEIQGANFPYPSAEAYQDLVSNPSFLAGGFISRGSYYPAQSERKIYPRIIFSSLNMGLLEAIKSMYGGNLYYHEPTNGRVLDIESAESVTIIKTVNPYLMVPDKRFAQYIG